MARVEGGLVEADNTDALLSRARSHIAEAIRLRGTAAKLKSQEARSRLRRLAALYEQLSLCYLEETCVLPAEQAANTAQHRATQRHETLH
jgi:hypothetical protein